MTRIRFDGSDERMMFHAKESWVPVVLGGIPVAVVCAALSWALVRFASVSVSVCVLASIVVVGVSRVPHIVDNWRTDVAVTDRRLYYRHGIVDVSDHVCDLGSITDVTIDPTILGRLFGYADVRIQTQAGDDDFVLKEIADAYEMRRVINVGRDALVGGTSAPAGHRRRRRS
ncbi:MAG: PH domain-containing protein [Acidobacteriota bacterium]|nr:PH domain-containing protein [Acidobacteriota bacterium]